MSDDTQHYIIELNYPKDKKDTTQPQTSGSFNAAAQDALRDFKDDLQKSGLADNTALTKLTFKITESMKCHSFLFIKTTEDVAEEISNFPSVLSIAATDGRDKPLRPIPPQRKR